MVVGREKEQLKLISLLNKDDSQFCVVYGRRRVGKTYLIRETFNYSFTFQHSGLADTDLRGQLDAFRNSLRAQGLPKCPRLMTWLDAFEKLKLLVDQAPDGKKVIFY